MRSFWLCKKANRKRALRFQVKKPKEKGQSPKIEFEIFEPKSDREVPNGTVTRAKASCPACNIVLDPGACTCADHCSARRGGRSVRCER